MSDRTSPEFILQRPGAPRIRPSHLISLIIAVIGLILIGIFAFDSYFVVEPTEMAGVRRLGAVITVKRPGPGLPFKLPLIGQVDPVQESLDTSKLAKLVVNTVDNQPIPVPCGSRSRIPP